MVRPLRFLGSGRAMAVRLGRAEGKCVEAGHRSTTEGQWPPLGPAEGRCEGVPPRGALLRRQNEQNQGRATSRRRGDKHRTADMPVDGATREMAHCEFEFGISGSAPAKILSGTDPRGGDARRPAGVVRGQRRGRLRGRRRGEGRRQGCHGVDWVLGVYL